MLVITRKRGQKILIPNANVEITLCKVLDDGRVRIGIEAPKDTRVIREELVLQEAKR